MEIRQTTGLPEGHAKLWVTIAKQAGDEITANVDVTYTLHTESKSHLEVVLYVGETMVYTASKKHNHTNRSLTERELNALMDNLGFVELFQEFLSF